MSDEYRDIINLPHHVSSKRPQMSMLDRAAQFSPFAALTGYDDAIHETGRLTDKKIDLNLKGLASRGIKSVYPSQMDCVWMLKQNGGGICDHEVVRP